MLQLLPRWMRPWTKAKESMMTEQLLRAGEYVLSANGLKHIVERTNAGFGIIRTGAKKTTILRPEEEDVD